MPHRESAPEFENRVDAGRRLAAALQWERRHENVVLGLPRGGVPVAAQVAQALTAPLDVIVVRKLGVPWQPELAMGAVGEDGASVINHAVVARARVGDDELAEVVAQRMADVERAAASYRRCRSRVPLTGATAVIVDDGIATGATARAACLVARVHGAARVVVATPVAPVDWTTDFAELADECVAVATPRMFQAVGRHYRDFSPTSDDEVCSALSHQAPREQTLTLSVEGVALVGQLTSPPLPRGLVVFAHGSGSSHRSVRNRVVASRLVAAGFTTAVFDLLTHREGAARHTVFDIDLLTRRLLLITSRTRDAAGMARMPLSFFGASTGAAAALGAAAELGSEVQSVICRGGRPDLAEEVLPAVRAPTLLVVGGADRQVLDLNRRALRHLTCPTSLEVVPDATHLFAEPGALDTVAELAVRWLDSHANRGDPNPP